MSSIERTILVQFKHQVHFTKGVFDPENLLLKDVLSNQKPGQVRKALVVCDETLVSSQPALIPSIVGYFKTFASELNLVCPPMVLEGGERAKNTDFHLTEIHSHIDRYHIDRHSYVIGIGGGALLDVVGL